MYHRYIVCAGDQMKEKQGCEHWRWIQPVMLMGRQVGVVLKEDM